MGPNVYYSKDLIRQAVGRGEHRGSVGGFWDEIGQLQRDFLVSRGLEHDAYVVDIGCGCLRAGIHLVEYLSPNHYYGVDISEDLIAAGYDVELAAAGLQHKLRRDNLICDGDFQFARLNQQFDVALAQSLFTHLPFNHIRLCLERLAPHMREQGVLYATFFLSGEASWAEPQHHDRGDVTTFPTQDPYHYRLEDIEFAVRGTSWNVTEVIDWPHPRDQMMAVLNKT